jgi:hypothetical protein
MPIRRLTAADIRSKIPAARRRGAMARARGLCARSVSFDSTAGRVVVETTTGFLFGFPVRRIPALRRASAAQLADVRVDGAGSLLAWDELDVHLSVGGLLFDAVGRSQRLTEFAREAGRATSERKAAAARANGAKGGRPRKKAGT